MLRNPLFKLIAASLLLVATSACSITPSPTQSVLASPALYQDPNSASQSTPRSAVLPAALRVLDFIAWPGAANNVNPQTLESGNTTEPSSDAQVGDLKFTDLSEFGTDGLAPGLFDTAPDASARNIVVGLVMSRANRSLTLRTRNGTRKIVGDQSTILINLATKPIRIGTLSDLTRGTPVLVVGQPGQDAFTARVIMILDKSMLPGTVNSDTPAPVPPATL